MKFNGILGEVPIEVLFPECFNYVDFQIPNSVYPRANGDFNNKVGFDKYLTNM